MFAISEENIAEIKKKNDKKIEDQKMWAMRYHESLKNGVEHAVLMQFPDIRNNPLICSSPSSESDKELDEELTRIFVSERNNNGVMDSLFDDFCDEKADERYITDWTIVADEYDSLLEWEDYVKSGIPHEELSFVADFCDQTGMLCDKLKGVPRIQYTCDAIIGLGNQSLGICDHKKIVSFSGVDINYDYIGCKDYDNIKDGETYNIIDVYRNPGADRCYPIHCSNSKCYMVEISGGRLKVKTGSAFLYGVYYRYGDRYYHNEQHAIVIEGNSVNVGHVSDIPVIRGAIIDCGVEKYQFSTEKTIDVRIDDKKIIISNNKVIGVSPVQNGYYEYKVDQNGVKEGAPFKVKYNHINLATDREYNGLISQCGHIKNVMKLPKSFRIPCIRKTMKHGKLLSLIKDCYVYKDYKLDVRRLRKDMHKKHAYYDPRCLHVLLLKMGFFYSNNEYIGRYILKPSRVCARIKWAPSQCTCYKSDTWEKDTGTDVDINHTILLNAMNPLFSKNK